MKLRGSTTFARCCRRSPSINKYALCLPHVKVVIHTFVYQPKRHTAITLRRVPITSVTFFKTQYLKF